MSAPRDRRGAPDDHLASSVRATELGRALRDVLIQHAPPALADRILHDALVRSGRARFPSTPAKLRDFVQDDLYDAVSEALDPSRAASVIAAVGPLLQTLETATRLTRSTAPAPRATRSDGPTIALLTEDPRLREALGDALARGIELHAPRSVPELRALVGSRTRCVVLIDLRAGVTASVARVGAALAGARALTWGDDPRAVQRIRAWVGPDATVLAFPGHLGPDDLAPVLENELEIA